MTSAQFDNFVWVGTQHEARFLFFFFKLRFYLIILLWSDKGGKLVFNVWPVTCKIGLKRVVCPGISDLLA